MKKLWKTKEFINLQKEWYEKLKESGFEDIEEFSPVYGNEVSFVKRSCADVKLFYKRFSDRFNYYRLCRNFLEHGPLLPKIDKIIWENHTEGLSYDEIVLKLHFFGFKRSKFFVYTQIKRLREQMRLWNSHSPEGIRDQEL